jgi:putative sugar O-methyltransferase
LDNKKNTSAWENYRKRLREDILKKDPRNFTNWKIIRETMFCIPSTQEYKSLMNSKNRTLWKEVIEESKIGNPKPYYLMKKSSGNIIHQAYHIQQLNNYSDINLSKINTIVEIGGGYGSMCRLIHRLGFKGTYIIFDLPEFLELQKFYLRLNNIPKEKIFYFSDYKKIKKITNSKQIDLFIGLWSFSECPLELRSEILEYLKKSDYVLLAYQDIFRNINNIKYFKELKKYFNNYDWYNQEISHIKNNYYLIGKNKKNN